MGFGAGASRAERKAKRRKLENSIPDIPDDLETESNHDGVSMKRKRPLEDDTNGDQTTSLDGNDESSKKDKDSNHKSKKSKTKSFDIPPSSTQPREPSDIAETEVEPKKSKKERKAERKAKEAAASSIKDTEIGKQNDPDSNAVEESNETTVDKKKRQRGKKQRGGVSGANEENKASRFIVFIGETLSKSLFDSTHICLLGNLPFTATTASIKNHFAAVKPASVRHLTEKENPTKSRGCAFLEFEGYDHMKTCLKQFHQSTFDDSISAPRKVNVELTWVLSTLLPLIS